MPKALPIWRVLLLGLFSFGIAVTGRADGTNTQHTMQLEEGQPRPQATLADVALLVGHWRGPFLGGTAEELWLPAVGDSMAGIFRLYAETSEGSDEQKVQFYEIMACVEEEGSVTMKLKHFHPDLRGWEEKDDTVSFRLVKATPEGLWFEGLTFLKQRDGSLKGYIALRSKSGEASEESFVYRPVGK